MDSGCSLAASIEPADVDLLRITHPGVPIVNYANTYVDVRAKSDSLCTSSNIVDIAIEITDEWGVDQVVLSPDRYLARNTQIELNRMYESGELNRQIEVLDFPGSCEVHERYEPEDIKELRLLHPGIFILAHPECKPEVLVEADYSGSTVQMANKIADVQPAVLAMITECAQGYQIAMAYPKATIVSSTCQGCPHMKRINLRNIYESLVNLQHEIIIPDDILNDALVPLEKMNELMERAAIRKAQAAQSAQAQTFKDMQDTR